MSGGMDRTGMDRDAELAVQRVRRARAQGLSRVPPFTPTTADAGHYQHRRRR